MVHSMSDAGEGKCGRMTHERAVNACVEVIVNIGDIDLAIEAWREAITRAMTADAIWQGAFD